MSVGLGPKAPFGARSDVLPTSLVPYSHGSSFSERDQVSSFFPLKVQLSF